MKLFLTRISVVVIFLKSVGLYLFESIIKMIWWGFNRKNWKTIRMYFEMAHKLTKFAKREKVAKNVGWLAKKFDDITKNYSHEDSQKAANEISSSKGILDSLKIGYKHDEITGSLGALEAKYNPKDGSVKFGLKL